MNAKHIHALVVSFLLILPAAPLLARSFPARCAGTYLIEEDGGARDFWTFAADGTFFWHHLDATVTQLLQPAGKLGEER